MQERRQGETDEGALVLPAHGVRAAGSYIPHAATAGPALRKATCAPVTNMTIVPSPDLPPDLAYMCVCLTLLRTVFFLNQ